ncbi:carbohydrate sulfotransferase 11-like [Asterias rubens]|uniref:carbohydrate sulfotransferase 11-like n=1 Tax=Asterias rubens TaxID=7604 RepID=UPI001455827D|nr:carbohydrate sulfotransferase 11-like [Asterias rubens]
MFRRRFLCRRILFCHGFAALVFTVLLLSSSLLSDGTPSTNSSVWKSIQRVWKSKEHWKIEMSARQKSRLQLFSHHCKKSLNLQPYRDPAQKHRVLLRYRDQYQHTYVDDDSRLMVSTVPLSGSSNWHEVFQLLGKKQTTSEVRKSSALVSRSQKEFLNIMDLYTKAIFVRNPLTRLVAVYREMLNSDALTPDSKIYKDEMARIVRMSRGPSVKDTDVRSINATIEEFGRFVVDKHHQDSSLWMPLSQKYNPCLFRFDFIGKFETAYDDVTYLLKLAELESTMIQQKLKLKKWNTSQIYNLTEFYSQLPSDIFQKLVAKYDADFKLFDYRRP